MRLRRPGLLPLRGRREDDGPVPRPRARAQRARVDAARSPTTRSSRRRPCSRRSAAYRPPQALIPEVRAFLEAVLGEVPPARGGARPGSRAAPARGRARRAAAVVHALADDDRGVAQAERDPGARATSRSTAGCSPARRRQEVEPLLRAALGPGDCELEWISQSRSAARARRSTRRSGGRSSGGSTSVEPGARLAPIVLRGLHRQPLRPRRRSARDAYGFFPLEAMDAAARRRGSSTPPTSGSRSTISSSASTPCAPPRRRWGPDGRPGSRHDRAERGRSRRRVHVPAGRGHSLRPPGHGRRRGCWDGVPNAGGAREVLVDPADLEAAREALAAAELGELSS